MNWNSKLLKIAMIGIVSLSISGCGTTRTSRIPEFVGRLGQGYTPEQKSVIGDMLQYINDLELDIAKK